MKVKLSKGFTLIELLVVIGILGILAGVLFFVINPTEQLSRGRDARTKVAIESLSNAISTYYAAYGRFPWTTSPPNCVPTVNGSRLSSAEASGCVPLLISAGLLRGSFDDNTEVLTAIFLSPTVGSRNFSLCFNPDSTSEDGVSNFAQNGAPYSSGSRYWCITQ